MWRQRMVKAVKAASRKVRRALEESAQRLHAPADSSLWRDAMRITGLRAAFVVTGDLTTALNQAMKLVPDLAGVHGHTLATKLFAQPLTRELVVFALSDTAMALRRDAGTS